MDEQIVEKETRGGSPFSLGRGEILLRRAAIDNNPRLSVVLRFTGRASPNRNGRRGVGGRMEIARCAWVNADPLYRAYHDEEWGRPVRGDRELFELLMLEGMQAGLSWYTILKKRENYREAFDGFDPEKIVLYDDAKFLELMNNPGIVRNRLKIAAVIANAGVYLELKKRGISFSEYLWSFAGGEPRVNLPKSAADVPASTPESDTMSKALKKLGMKFVGSTICYAFMQASGMVNDHTRDCAFSGLAPDGQTMV